jgi:hypothetical protein
MPCLIAVLALAFPRLAVVLVWFFNTGYFSRAFGSTLLPLLGFVFLPLTTLTFAYAHNSLGQGGQMTSLGWLLTLIALLLDFGLLGGGHRHYRRRRRV